MEIRVLKGQSILDIDWNKLINDREELYQNINELIKDKSADVWLPVMNMIISIQCIEIEKREPKIGEELIEFALEDIEDLFLTLKH